MRIRFEEQLRRLNVELITMGALCEDAISAAIKGLLADDEPLLQKVFAADHDIDRKERDIESLCMRLLLQQQPVARDLRVISSALKMISDMERIGDQAADIAEITKYIQNHRNEHLKSRLHIHAMAAAAVKMVTDSIDSFVKKDLALARSVMAYDDVVDKLFDEVKQELIELISEKSADGELCVDFLMIAKYLERIGDHAVNIAEWVEFSITGRHLSEEWRDTAEDFSL
ncbi:MAG: phosphate transport system regulatory protein PhoU [Clostridiales bacterium]|nr:MAG: phosphate transport system regulatory protein PhoU [Clostridiales bacterium]PWL53420.1 MAG: phosphate transport system regulatory protein PhoU [Clostridiales bacterium]